MCVTNKLILGVTILFLYPIPRDLCTKFWPAKVSVSKGHDSQKKRPSLRLAHYGRDAINKWGKKGPRTNCAKGRSCYIPMNERLTPSPRHRNLDAFLIRSYRPAMGKVLPFCRSGLEANILRPYCGLLS